jgi:hypothetical protein
VKHIEITVILTRATNPLLKKQPQVCLVEIGPRVAEKTSRARSAEKPPSRCRRPQPWPRVRSPWPRAT